MLKIEKNTGRPGEEILILSGELSADILPEIRRLIAEGKAAGHQVVLDLEHVRCAGREAVRFLTRGEGRFARLANSPSYLQVWCEAEGRRKKASRPAGAEREERP